MTPTRSEQDVIRVVRSWLDEGVDSLPDHVLDGVLEQLPATRQGRASWPTRRIQMMSGPFKVAAVASIGVIAVVGIRLAPGTGEVGGQIGPSSPSPVAASPAADPLGPMADVDAFVMGAYEGLVDLPPLSITTVEVEGTKARYFHDGVGTLRHDHYGNKTDSTPSGSRIFSRDQMAELASLAGRSVWLVHGGQGHPMAELAHATGLRPYCETAWEYRGLETLIGRPTHHVACGESAMWLDVETHLPLKSIHVQPEDVGPTIAFDVLELEVGPQPAELFEPPEGVEVMTDLEFDCASDPACVSPPTPGPSAPPLVRPAPAPGDDPAPPDLDAFVAEVLATYETIPPLEMVIESWDSRAGRRGQMRHLTDGSGRSRAEWLYDPDEPPTIYLRTGGHVYESFLMEDGSVIWQDHGSGGFGPDVPDLGLSQGCREGWEHRGFDLVMDRPAHHLVCGDAEYWVDQEWRLAVRNQYNPGPLEYETYADEVVELRFVQPPDGSFELPQDADVRSVGCISRSRPGCEARPTGDVPPEATGEGPSLTWSQVVLDEALLRLPDPGWPFDRTRTQVAWLGDRFLLVDEDAEAVSTSPDGLTWRSHDPSDPEWGYFEPLALTDSMATWDDAVVGWDRGSVRVLRPPAEPVMKSDFEGQVGAIGIGPGGVVIRMHSALDFDAFITTFLGPDWVGHLETFDFRDGILHIRTDDGRSADIVWADHGLEPGDVADRGIGWFSPDGEVWTSVPGFPANVSEVVGVPDGFIARGDDGRWGMWHSPDGLTWREIGPATEGSVVPWREGALLTDGVGRFDLWTAAGPRPLPFGAELPQWSTGSDATAGAGPLGLVAVSFGARRIMYTPDGVEWSIGSMPDAMHAEGGGRRPTTVAVGDDTVLLLLWSGAEAAIPSLWRGTLAD